MKTYAAKSSVKRATIKTFGKAHFDAGTIEKNEEGKFYFQITIASEEEKKVQIGIDEELALEFGTTFCPNCNIHLGNGINTNDNQIDSGLPLFEKYEFMCLACDHEFGPEIKTKDEAPKKKKVYKNSSTAASPCSLVWSIAEEMGTEAKRKDVLKECEAQGVAFYTARTQYQKYKEALRGETK